MINQFRKCILSLGIAFSLLGRASATIPLTNQETSSSSTDVILPADATIAPPPRPIYDRCPRTLKKGPDSKSDRAFLRVMQPSRSAVFSLETEVPVTYSNYIGMREIDHRVLLKALEKYEVNTEIGPKIQAYLRGFTLSLDRRGEYSKNIYSQSRLYSPSRDLSIRPTMLGKSIVLKFTGDSLTKTESIVPGSASQIPSEQSSRMITSTTNIITTLSLREIWCLI